MTPPAFRAAIRSLWPSVPDAACALGVDASTIRRWGRGARAVPAPVVRLLWACERDDTLASALENALSHEKTT